MNSTPKYVGFVAMSLDGFIADSDGGIGWLDPFNDALAADGGDGGYGNFIAEVDAVLMGRTTYQQVMGWGWPYESRAGYVLTQRRDFKGDNVTTAGPIDALKEAIETNGHHRVWIMGGGKTQRAALDAHMFDDLSLFIMPTLLGRGLPCFAPGVQRNLTLIATHQREGGILQLDYSFKD